MVALVPSDIAGKGIIFILAGSGAAAPEIFFRNAFLDAFQSFFRTFLIVFGLLSVQIFLWSIFSEIGALEVRGQI